LDGSEQTPKGDGHLAGCQPLMLAVGQGPGLTPDPVATAVELEGGQGVHGCAGALGGDRVIPLGGAHGPVTHEVPEHVNRGAGVGVPLGKAVPVGVEEHRGLVELAPVL